MLVLTKEAPDLSATPFAYTSGEGMRFQLWDNPRHPNAILWEDGHRWDRHNGYTEGLTSSNMADLKESLIGGMWRCKTHDRLTDYVFRCIRTCPPMVDDDLNKCQCVKED